MKRQLYILILSALLIGCAGKTSVTLPTFSSIAVTPEKSTYAVGDQVECSVTMLTPGDASLKQATYWFTSSPITLTEKGEVRIYFWGRLEYPNWDFQPIQIPVTLKVE